MSAAQDRLGAYRETPRETGRRSIVAIGDFTRISGAEAMFQLLDDGPALDAAFAANDLMAIGALRALRRAGRRVPDDVAVAGYVDLEATLHADPSLTPVRSPMGDQAVASARLLLDLMENRPMSSVVLPTELIVGDSS